jgi:hypothetical protein
LPYTWLRCPSPRRGRSGGDLAVCRPIGDGREHLEFAPAQTDSPDAHRRCQRLGQVVAEHRLPRAGRRPSWNVPVHPPISSSTSRTMCSQQRRP